MLADFTEIAKPLASLRLSVNLFDNRLGDYPHAEESLSQCRAISQRGLLSISQTQAVHDDIEALKTRLSELLMDFLDNFDSHEPSSKQVLVAVRFPSASALLHTHTLTHTRTHTHSC